MEIWKDIPQFKGRYQVSNLGRIKSLDKYDSWGRLRKGKILKYQIDINGYCRYRISYENKKYTIRLHRAVAEAFIENNGNKPQVNHINGDKTNNKTTNLEWCTNAENQQHAIDTGLKVCKTGSQAAKFVSSVLVYDMKMNYLYKLDGNKQMKEKGFDYRLISLVVNGKRKHHKQHIFKRYLIPLQ